MGIIVRILLVDAIAALLVLSYYIATDAIGWRLGRQFNAWVWRRRARRREMRR